MPVTREIFEQQCKRRFGTSNPERMRLEHWEWMIRHNAGPYGVRQDLGMKSNYFDCGPEGCKLVHEADWCFQRLGMSRTFMPDGRIICIAGEHEDSYDPDFCIYNDVTVLRPAPGQDCVTPDSGEVEMYAYPRSEFACTDFHSATLVGKQIYIIGRLGYGRDEGDPGPTPVYVLDTETYRITHLHPNGESPGWIHNHHGSYDTARHAITVRGGELYREQEPHKVSHFAAHRLYIEDLRWELLCAQEKHRKFLLTETGGNCAEIPADAFRLRNVEHFWLPPEEQGVTVFAIDVHGVRIRIEDFYNDMRVHVDGELAPETLDKVLFELRHNLENATTSQWRIREVDLFR